MGLVLAAEVVGFALAWAASRFGASGPVVLVAMVAVPAVLAFVAADPSLAVPAVLLAFPFGTRNVAGPIDLVQFAVMAVGGVVLTVAAVRGRVGVPAPVWWLVGLFGWTLVSLPFATDVVLAVREVALLLVALVWLMVVVVTSPRTADVRRGLGAFLALMGLVASLSVLTSGGAQPLYGGSIVEGRVIGFTGDPNSWGTVCMMAALVAFALALGGVEGRWRTAAAVAAVPVVASLVLSFSRGSWIGMAVGVGVLACTLPRARRALAVTAVIALPAAVVLGAVLPSVPQLEVARERLSSIFGEKSPWDYRPDIWAEGRRAIVENPLVGEGPGNFPVVSQERALQARTPVRADHGHNLLLTWGAEAGLPAMALLVVLSVHVGVAARRARRRAARAGRHRDVALLAGLSAALAGVMAQGLVDYTLRHSVVFVAIMAVLGFLLAAIRAEQAAVEVA